MKKDNDNEERLIEFIVTVGSLLFFALLTIYSMRGCESDREGIVATTVVATENDEPTDENVVFDVNQSTAVVVQQPVMDGADDEIEIVELTEDTMDTLTIVSDEFNGTAESNSSAESNNTEVVMTEESTDSEVKRGDDTNRTNDGVTDERTDVQPIKDSKDGATGGKTEAEEEAGIISDINSEKLSAQTYILKGIYFRSGSSMLSNKSKRQLDVIATALKAHKSVKITLRGHTDSKGSKKENQALSLKRASSVGMALVDRGVNIDNIWIDGMGESEPIAVNGTEKEMLLNRRVDIAVTK